MQLYYRHFGEGKPVIILHGLFGQSDNWVTIGRRIASGFSVYIPDMRNHGQSPQASVHTYEAMADDIAAFYDEHRIESAILIGHSMGGKAAMWFTLENPSRVAKLAVIDISLRRYPERNIHTRVISQMLTLDLQKLGSRQAVEQELERRQIDTRIRMFMLKNLYYKQHGQLAWRLNLEAINNNLDQLFGEVEPSGKYSGPVLFVRGGNSDYITDDDIPLITSRFPQAQVKKIPGASHWVHADAPEDLCLLLSAFLGKDCIYNENS